MSIYLKRILPPLIVALMLVGCSGTKTFHELARAGDTVALAAGYKHHFSRDNITVTITDANGATTVYPPGSTEVRASVNLYPDPMSSWIVSDRTGVEQTPYAQTYVDENLINNTNGDYDWWLTTVFVNLPVTMQSNSLPPALGNATILVETPAGPDYESYTATVNIVSGAGKAHDFQAVTENGAPFKMNNNQMQALERVPTSVLNFSGSTVPYAIQVDLSHNPDQDNGGAVGDKAYVANPVGQIKSINWHDDGINTRIILMPNRDSDITAFQDFKLYLAGIGGWTVVDAKGYDINGAELTSPDNITASITPP